MVTTDEASGAWFDTVTMALQSPAGYLRSGVTATLADQIGSAVFFCSGLPTSGVSVEISVSFVDAASVGVSETGSLFSRFTFWVVFYCGISKF